MTLEEIKNAHKTLEDLQRLLTCYRHISMELTEANGIAIEALEKQIPKKPIHSYNGIKSVYECPVCHYPLLYKCGCYNNECRQKIDWSEE